MTNLPNLPNLSDNEAWSLYIHCINILIRVAKRLSIRQQVIASAAVYFARSFFNSNTTSNNSNTSNTNTLGIGNIDPLLLSTTCFYIATKTEEIPLHPKSVLTEFKTVISLEHASEQEINFPYDTSHIAEMEYYLLTYLNFDLIIQHPYAYLISILEKLELKDSYLQICWFLTNDVYKTDLMLRYDAVGIALGIVFLASVFVGESSNTKESVMGQLRQGELVTNTDTKSIADMKPKDRLNALGVMFAECNHVATEDLIDIAQTLLDLYSHQSSQSTNPTSLATLLNKLAGVSQNNTSHTQFDGTEFDESIDVPSASVMGTIPHFGNAGASSSVGISGGMSV